MLHGWIVGFCGRTLSELDLNGRLTNSKELLGAVVPPVDVRHSKRHARTTLGKFTTF